MHVGSIVHEILQRVLRRNLTTVKEIQRVADEFLKTEATVHLLYSCRMNLSQMTSLVEPFIERIHEFMRQYVIGDLDGGPCMNQNVKPFEGRISEIVDIEENVWCPRLGLKGKIDVTVKVNPPNKFFNSFQKLLPLEIKTGKASFSLEHKGQLIIYQMMMQDLGKQIDSGLLLYIKEGIMSEVTAPNVDRRGLIQMRNRLAHFMNLDLVSENKEANLPPPINHHSACGRCEHNTVCCTFLQSDKNMHLKPDHPLVKVKDKVSSHLTQVHIDYFLHWCHLVTLEHNESQKSIKIRHIWTKDPEVRAKKGSALIKLKISDLVQPVEDEFVHHFESSVAGFDFTNSSFEVGEYLIVSTDKRCSVAAGRVSKLESSVITMSLPRDLSIQYSNCVFHLDRYESSSQSVFNYSNVAALLENQSKVDGKVDEKYNRLRKIIIEKTPATFSKALPKSVALQGEKILLQMNSVQRKAVLKALTCENYMLIKGLPGTGKTQTLIQLIQLLLIMKKSILITSHTNSAVDNILLRLKDRGIKFLRLGSASRTHPLLRDHLESSLIADCKTVEDLDKVYKEHQIVAVTCLGSSHALLSERRFDFCLVDEATQIFQPTVLRPLLSADKFILVGDPEQLAPLVRSSEGRAMGADESLFERLDSPESTMVLGLQYRMNRVITKLANNLTYQGQLTCANEGIEKATMKVTTPELLREKLHVEKWLAKALSTHIDQSCCLINTGDVSKIATQFNAVDAVSSEITDKTKLYVNYCEIAIVLRLVDILMECGMVGSSIGVIAPYRNQVDALKKVLCHHPTVEVNTVDQYQGRDKNVIIYSCTQSKVPTDAPKTSDVEILEDRRRLTVAITRAKHKLVMIGDHNCLVSYTPFRDLFKHINAMSKIQVEDGKFGFAWKSLLDDLRPKL